MSKAMLMGDIWCDCYGPNCYEIVFKSDVVDGSVILNREEARLVAAAIDGIIHCSLINGESRSDYEVTTSEISVSSADFSKVLLEFDGLRVVVHDYDLGKILDVLRGDDR